MTISGPIAVLAVAAAMLLPVSAAAETSGTAGQAGAEQTDGAQISPVKVEPQANLPDLEDEVMCPICGTLLGLSRAPAAERQRVFMRRLIREGKTGQEIKDALVAEYGPQVLALPDDESINFWVYVVPLAGLILGAIGVFWAGIRWRRSRDGDGGSGPAAAGPTGADSDRLDRALDDYDR